MNSSADPTIRKTVSGMPWIDSDGDTGFYTGDVNNSNLPDGMGLMRYDDGPVLKGRWKEGEMVIEEEDATPKASSKLNNSQSSSGSGARGGGGSIDPKQQQLQQFHERNQQFLLSQGQQQQQMSAEEALELATNPLHNEINQLQEQVHQLSRELRITQDTHQLNKDQSRAEFEMLHTELDRQNSRHEQIVASLRNRLVESEMARMKMQDQLSTRMEEDAVRDEDLKSRWKEMTTRVLEDKKWVDEQMDYWKESMEEHRKRLSGAKVRGGMDAGLGGDGDGMIRRGSDGTSGSGGVKGSVSKSGSTQSETNRRLSQRKLWGAYDEDDGDESEDDEEEMRLFGSKK